MLERNLAALSIFNKLGFQQKVTQKNFKNKLSEGDKSITMFKLNHKKENYILKLTN